MSVSLRTVFGLWIVGFATVCQGADRQSTPDEVMRAKARLVWSIVEVIEKHDIAAPTRRALLTKVGTTFDRSPKRNDARTRLVDSQTSDQFVDRFVALWKETPGMAADDFLGKLMNELGRDNQIRLLHAKDYAVEEQLQNNRYVGLGVTLGMEGVHPQFTTIIPGGTAERGGLQDGETVLEVDGRTTAGVAMPEILTWLRGAKGSQVTLKLAAMKELPEREVTLTRGVVRIDSVAGFTGPVSRASLRIESNEPIGYLRVKGITSSTLQELRDAEVRLRAQAVRALVLDFRGSSSDNFHQAHLVADGLLDGGTIWTRHERSNEPIVEMADRECLFRDMPLVILVEASTGRGMAAVAAALQDRQRAVIVGSPPTYNGRVSDVIPLADGEHLLRLNVARLGRGHSKANWPLTPDHLVEQDSQARLRSFQNDIREQIQLRASRGIPSALAPANVFRPSASDSVANALPREMDFYRRRGIASGELATSALFPANLQEVEILRRLTVINPWTNPAVQNAEWRGPDPLPKARAVAAELLRARDASSIAGRD